MTRRISLPQSRLILFLLSLVLCSCGLIKRGSQSKTPSRNVYEQVAAFNRINGNQGGKNAEMSNIEGFAVPESVKKTIENAPSFQRPEDIVWTVKDQTEDDLSEDLKEILARVRKDEGPWRKNFKKAEIVARNQGKPLLIWFTDSKRSSVCKALLKDIFGNSKFEEWAQENVVKVCVDRYVGGLQSFGAEGDRATKKKNVNKKLRERYKVKGSPMVILQLPDGSIVDRYRGYRSGNREYYFSRIREDVVYAKEKIATWRKKLEAKGYRTWTSHYGQTVFCKPVAYKKGVLALVDPAGKRFRVKEKNLSLMDQKWISEQKAKKAKR